MNKFVILLILVFLVGCTNTQRPAMEYDDFLNKYESIMTKAQAKEEYRYFTYIEEEYDTNKTNKLIRKYEFNTSNYYLNITIATSSDDYFEGTISYKYFIDENYIYNFIDLNFGGRVVKKSYFKADKNYILKYGIAPFYEEYKKDYEETLAKSVLLDRMAYLDEQFANRSQYFNSTISLTPYLVEDNLMVEFDYAFESDDEYNDMVKSEIAFSDDSITRIGNYYEDNSYFIKNYDDKTEVLEEIPNIADYEFNEVATYISFYFNYI